MHKATDKPKSVESLPLLLNARERTIRNGKKEMGKVEYTSLPGVSYLPHKLEIAEDKIIQERVSAEFVDFLDCVTDLLQVVSMIRQKHLMLPKPLPPDVIRDIQLHKNKSTALKRLDHQSSTLLRVNFQSQQSLPPLQERASTKALRPSLKEESCNGKRYSTQVDLHEIVGRKGRPQWQAVLKGSRAKVSDGIVSTSKRRPVKGGDYKAILKKHNNLQDGVFRTHSEELLRSIQYVRGHDLDPTSKHYEQQMDMIEAYFDGFTSVQDHKEYLDSLKPHWFTDLLRLSLDTGLEMSPSLRAAYLRLGEFYAFMNDKHEQRELCRAKLCLTVHSLPVWDATRMTLQRAVEFILREIFLATDPTHDLSDWLTNRKLPYVVLPPINSTYMDEFESSTTDKDKAS